MVRDFSRVSDAYLRVRQCASCPALRVLRCSSGEEISDILTTQLCGRDTQAGVAFAVVPIRRPQSTCDMHTLVRGETLQYSARPIVTVDVCVACGPACSREQCARAGPNALDRKQSLVEVHRLRPDARREHTAGSEPAEL